MAIITLCYALKIEKQKKALDIQTFREITAFLEGKRLDEIDKQREYGKRNCQKVFLALGAALIGGIITAFMLWLLF